jgi:hypothetical protein
MKKQFGNKFEWRHAKRNRLADGAGMVIVGLLFAVTFACALYWNQRIYGDWRCTFAHCVIVAPARP